MKKVLLFLCICLWAGNFAGAQNQNDVLKQQREKMKQQQAQFKKFQKETKEGLKKLEQDYQDFVKQRDQEFSDFLRKTWEEFDILAGREPQTKPKPKDAPVATSEQEDGISRLSGETGRKMPDLEPVVRLRKEVESGYGQKTVQVDFYGNHFQLNPDSRLCQSFTLPVSEENISVWWLKMSETAYDDLLDVLFSLKKQMGLNDWGYYMLLSKVSEACTEGDNSRQLLTWFLLNKSGFIANIGYEDNRLSLLLPTMQEIYFMPYIMKEGIRYYLVHNLENVKTYEGHLGGSDRFMDLRFTSALNFPAEYITHRTLNYRGKELSIAYNAKIKEFYNDYPATVLDVYFNAPVSSVAKESLAEQLLPLIDSLPERGKVEILLSLLHESFPYKTDEEQFGQEKYFFAEEMLVYPYSDCEDRAVFFSYLVKTLIGLPEVGLNYDGHVSTAVQLSEETEGDYLEFRGARYWACDPTYLGASVGMSMPEYAKAGAGIIPLTTDIISRDRLEKIFSLVKEAGGLILNIYDNMLADEHGNVYLTGVYEQAFQFGEQAFAQPAGRTIFVGKINARNQPEWAISLGGKGNNMPGELKMNEGNLLLSGEYEGDARFGTNVLYAANKRDLFVTEITPDGEVKWAAGAGLKQDVVKEGYSYQIKFNLEGKLLASEVVPEVPAIFRTGLVVTPRREVLLTGTFNEWSGIRIASAVEKHSMEQVDMSERLKEIADAQLEKKTDKGIAGLLAVIELVNTNNVPVSGEMAVKTLDKYNPTFRTRCPNIYKSIRRITFIRNNEGIVLLKTQDGKSVNFDKVQVKDGSRMKIVDLPENSKRVEIIDGIVVGKAFIWFNLNQVTLYATKGDMLFDYDKDHTLRTFNMSKDILK